LRKIGFILVYLILYTQCSVIRNGRSLKLEAADTFSSEERLQNIKKQNITAKSFIISKAEIKVTTAKGDERLMSSIKFEYPDKYLISLKNETGIEGARIFVSSDTIIVNDRINRKLFYGSPDYIRKKYDVTFSVMPVILGDLLTNSLSDESGEICVGGKVRYDWKTDEANIEYVADCRFNKVILSVFKNSFNERKIEINYSNFLKSNDIFYPG
jgi:hypothetical protein